MGDISESHLFEQIGQQEQRFQDLEDQVAGLHNQSMEVVGWEIWRQVIVAAGTWWLIVLQSPLRVIKYLLVSVLFKGREMREQEQWRVRLPS